MTELLQFTNVDKGLHTYTPEMGDRKPAASMEARMGHYGTHYFINTPFQLVESRSIKLQKQYKASDFTNPDNHKVGWYQYKVTAAAFEKLIQQHSISMESHLD